jgi:hypothetical protein
MKILHTCSACGYQVTEFCPVHPSAHLDSTVVVSTDEHFARTKDGDIQLTANGLTLWNDEQTYRYLRQAARQAIHYTLSFNVLNPDGEILEYVGAVFG